MQLAKRIIIGAAIAAAATGLTTGVANASTSLQPWYPPPPATIAVTHISNIGTVPGNGGNWASDTLVRRATVAGGNPVAPSYCGETTGWCFSYTAVVRDTGSFTAIRGALAPNQWVKGKRIRSAVSGSVSGIAQYTFYATTQPHSGLVPKYYLNNTLPTLWPELFFPAGTTFVGVTGTPFTVSYGAWTACGYQRWTESSYNGYGNLPGDGNIVGCHFFHRHWYWG